MSKLSRKALAAAPRQNAAHSGMDRWPASQGNRCPDANGIVPRHDAVRRLLVRVLVAALVVLSAPPPVCAQPAGQRFPQPSTGQPPAPLVQTGPPAPLFQTGPVGAGMEPAPTSGAGDSELRQRLAALIAQQCQTNNIPGYAISVVKDGRIFFQSGFGLADIESRRPVTPETIFGLASVTKTFTALCLLMLVDRGQINLDDSVDRYLPDLSGHWAKLTIRQLATMTAGLPKGLPRELPWPQEMRVLEKEPLLFSPGTDYCYSNPSYRLLGSVIEKVTGRPYAQVVAELITGPLSMASTGPPEMLFQTGLIAAPYGDDKGTAPVHRIAYKPSEISFSAGMLFSNVIDLSRYAQSLLDNRVMLSPQGYRTLLYDRPPLPSGQPSNWAFGWGSRVDAGLGNQRRIGMNGGDPAVSSTILLFPDSRLIVIGLSNIHRPEVYRIAQMAARLILAYRQIPTEAEAPEGEPY
ncbi:MAG TPA: serine hydrolase domain-containing protein [Candidatus Obscuribacterales bacterium]